MAFIAKSLLQKILVDEIFPICYVNEIHLLSKSNWLIPAGFEQKHLWWLAQLLFVP